MYLCQEGGGEMKHIYNHPKGGLVPPPKEGLWGVGGSDFFFYIQGCSASKLLSRGFRSVV